MPRGRYLGDERGSQRLEKTSCKPFVYVKDHGNRPLLKKVSLYVLHKTQADKQPSACRQTYSELDLVMPLSSLPELFHDAEVQEIRHSSTCAPICRKLYKKQP